MSEYMFGVVNYRFSPAVERICKSVAGDWDCVWVGCNPGGGWRSWFSIGPSRGEPFDRNLAESVLSEVERRAGVVWPPEPIKRSWR